MRSGLTTLAVLSLSFAACSAPAPEPSGSEVADSAGIRITTITDMNAIPIDTIGADRVQIVYGDQEGEELFWVLDLLWRDDSSFHLLDRDQRLLTVGLDRTIMAEAGGAGEGPGEFRDAVWMSRLDESGLIALDNIGGRLTTFDASLGVVEMAQFDPALPEGLLALIGAAGDGSLLGFPLLRVDGEVNPRREGLWGYREMILIHPDGSRTTFARHAWNLCDPDRTDRCSPMTPSGEAGLWARGVLVAPKDWAELQVYDRSGELIAITRGTENDAYRFLTPFGDHEGAIYALEFHGTEQARPLVRFDAEGRPSERWLLPDRVGLGEIRQGCGLGVSRDEMNVHRVALIDLTPGACPDVTR